MNDDRNIMHFNGFALDPTQRTLTHAGRPVSIQDKPLDLLIYLIRHRGRVVPRNEVLRAVWADVMVGPQALGFALHVLRRALGDDGKQQTLIRTYPRRGILFAADVTSDRTTVREDAGYQTKRPELFLSRERLHRDVERAIGAVLRGSGQVLLVHGEAGIGKTCALQRIAHLAHSRGLRVCSGYGVQGDQAPAYWPWVQVLRGMLSGATPDARASIVDDGALQLATLMPELQPRPLDTPPEPLEVAQTTRFLLFDSVSRFIRESSGPLPHCIVIDDMQFFDAGSLALFEHLARDLSNARVLIVGSYRDVGLRSMPELATAVAASTGLRNALHLELSALPLDGITAVVEGLYGVVPSPIVAIYLYSRTNGNPFFLSQLLRVLEAEDRLHELLAERPPEIELPLQVRTAIYRQILFLPGFVIRTLEAGAVCGREFKAGDIQEALSSDPSELNSAIHLAMDARVLRRTRATGTFSFNHVLLRDAIYSSLSSKERLALHRSIGTVIERKASSVVGPRSAELAYHFSRTVEVDGVDQAVRYAQAAALWAEQRAGFEEAVAHLENADALLKGAGQIQSQLRCEVLIKLAEARIRAGDRAGASEALLEVAHIARESGWAPLLASAALRYTPDFLALETGVYDGEQVAMLEDALHAIGNQDEAIRAQLLSRLAVALHWSDEARARRDELIENSRVLVRRSGDPGVASAVETAATLAGFSIDEPQKLLARSFVAEANCDPVSLLIRRLIRITALWLMGKIGLVRAEIEEFGAAARRLRQPQAIWYESLLRSSMALMEGQFARSAELAQEFLKKGELAGDRNSGHSFLLQSFMASVDVGDVERFEDGLRAMVASFPRVMGWRSGLLLFLAETDRLSEAEELLDELVASDALGKQKRNEWYALIGAMAISAARTGSARHSGSLYRVLAGQGDQLAVVGYGSFCWGSTQQLLGLCAMAGSNLVLARKHFEKAIEINRLSGALPAMARSHGDLALCLMRSGSVDQSHWHADQCLRVSNRLGMARVARRVAGILDG